MLKEAGLLIRLPKLVNAERVLATLPTRSDAATTILHAVPRARDLTEALGQLAQAASQRPVNEEDLLPLRSVFARLDGLPQTLSGAREPLGVAFTEIEGDR